MTEVLHVPGNISILKHTYSDEVQPAETTLQPPITPHALLSDIEQWNTFDTLNLHTVELTSMDALRELVETAKDRNKRILFTMHELQPNIESDQEYFDEKTRFVVRNADKIISLTEACAQACQEKYGVSEEDIVVIPHGQPFLEPAISEYTHHDTPDSIAAYGALRTYRSYSDLVRAWANLDSATRPELRLCLRSVNKTEQKRYEHVLADLSAFEGESGYSLELYDGFLSSDELVDWLKKSDTLALPYSAITHSGQLETGLDLGMVVIAPDVDTLKSQVENHPRNHLVHYVGANALANVSEYGRALVWKPAPEGTEDLSVEAVQNYRARQLETIRQTYAKTASRPH